MCEDRLRAERERIHRLFVGDLTCTAAVELARFLDANPAFGLERYAHAETLVDLDRYAEADRAIAEARKHIADGGAKAKRLLICLLGRMEMRRGRLESAARVFNTAAGVDPGDPKPHLFEHHCRFLSGDLDGAERAARRACDLERGPELGAWLGIGRVLRSRERLPEAEEALSKALALDPGDASARHVLEDVREMRREQEETPGESETEEALWTRARDHHYAGRPGAAALVLRRYLSARPHSGWAWVMYAESLGDLSRYEDAGLAFESARSFVPTEGRNFHRLLLCGTGKQLKRTGKYREAVSIFEKSVEVDPDDPRSYAYLATCHIGLGELPRAEEVLRRALRCEGGPIDEVLANLGSVLRSLGRVAEAEEMLERSLEIDPEYTWAKDVLEDVRACLRLGKPVVEFTVPGTPD